MSQFDLFTVLSLPVGSRERARAEYVMLYRLARITRNSVIRAETTAEANEIEAHMLNVMDASVGFKMAPNSWRQLATTVYYDHLQVGKTGPISWSRTSSSWKARFRARWAFSGYVAAKRIKK